MKILFLAHRIPYPPDKGEKIRAYEELRFLAQRHSVDLFCLAESADEAAGARGLTPFCRKVFVQVLPRSTRMLRMLGGLIRGEPLTVAYFRSKAFATSVQAALKREQYDAAVVYCSSMAQYVEGEGSTPILTDFVDADSAKWAQYARTSHFPSSFIYRREASLLARVEQGLAASSAVSIATTDRELSLVGGGGVLGTVIRNGVRLSPAGPGETPEEIRRLQPYAVFIGQMDYRPNVDAAVYFAKDVLPRIRSRHQRLNFLIVGRSPAKAVRNLAANPGVIVTGAVRDVEPYLAAASVAVAPFRISQGIHNKILEALAAGVSVVTTSAAAAALDNLREAVTTADDPEDFASAVVAICNDPGARQHAQMLRSEFQAQLAWESNLTRLEQLLESIAGKKHPAGVGACV